MIFSKIKNVFTSKITEIFGSNKDLDLIMDELEETLIMSDIGFKTTNEICSNLRKRLFKEKDISRELLIEELKKEMISILETHTEYNKGEEDFNKKAILIVGVNGVGKTTSIAKISNIYKKEGKKVILAAADTFRAGAREQLEIWAEVAEVECIVGEDNADPASVIYEAAKVFANEDYNVLICDTAGRLHNKKNLMEEIAKIKRIIDKNLSKVQIEVLMVIDAMTGQNAIEQVKAFYDKTSIDGIILTKMDSTSKGGIVFGIINEFKVPIKYIGTGEKISDIRRFNAEEFVNNII